MLTLALPDGGDETHPARRARQALGRACAPSGATRGGKVLWRVTNDNFKDHGDVRLPDIDDVEEPPHGADAEIKLRSVEPNVELKDELFRLPPPEGVPPRAGRLLAS